MLPFTKLPLPGKPWHSPHLPSKIALLLCAIHVPDSPGHQALRVMVDAFMFQSGLIHKVNYVRDSARGFPRAGASKIGAAFVSNQPKFNRRAGDHSGGEISGVFSEYCKNPLLQKKERKQPYKSPSPILFLSVVRKHR